MFDMSLTYILVALAAVLLNNVVVERLNLHTRITTGTEGHPALSPPGSSLAHGTCPPSFPALPVKHLCFLGPVQALWLEIRVRLLHRPVTPKLHPYVPTEDPPTLCPSLCTAVFSFKARLW